MAPSTILFAGFAALTEAPGATTRSRSTKRNGQKPTRDVEADLDPTKDRFVSDRYVTNAYGRDYEDVSPLKGVIFTESTKNELQISVDMAPVDATS